MPDTYTNFRKAVEAQSRVRKPAVMPDCLKPLPPDVDPGQLPSLTQLGVQGVPLFLEFIKVKILSDIT